MTDTIPMCQIDAEAVLAYLVPVPLDDAGAFLGGTLIAAMMIAAAWKAMPWVEAQKGASGWL